MGNQIGASLPRGTVTKTGLAKRLQVSRSTVERWQRDGVIEPSGHVQAGKLRVAVYDQAAIRRIQRQQKARQHKETK